MNNKLTIRDYQKAIKKKECFLRLLSILNDASVKYALSDGTLLGAIRHGGIIPWDNNINISIMRHNASHLCQVCLDNNYILKYMLGNPFYFIDKEMILNTSPALFAYIDISNKDFVYVDDSYFSGRTVETIRNYLLDFNSTIKEINVVYNGSKNKNINSFYNYYY